MYLFCSLSKCSSEPFFLMRTIKLQCAIRLPFIGSIGLEIAEDILNFCGPYHSACVTFLATT